MLGGDRVERGVSMGRDIVVCVGEEGVVWMREYLSKIWTCHWI